MPQAGGGALLLRARAKVNLYLHVTGKRPDGYHELDSLMVFPELWDELAVERAAELSLEVAGPFAAALEAEGGENLALRAARMLAAEAGGGRGARLRLTKNLPVAAGIGGGSADAAAALRGLSRLWDLDLPAGRLQALALELGADVPPCLESRPVFARGIGEVLTPAPELPPFWLVLVNPRVPVPTAKVFKLRRGDFTKEGGGLPEGVCDFESLVDMMWVTFNDLEDPAMSLAPEIEEVIRALRDLETCRFERMSGSGATCFGLFERAAEAEAAAAELAAAHPDWWVAAAPVTAERGPEAD